MAIVVVVVFLMILTAMILIMMILIMTIPIVMIIVVGSSFAVRLLAMPAVFLAARMFRLRAHPETAAHRGESETGKECRHIQANHGRPPQPHK